MMIAALLRCKITMRDKYARAGRKRIFYIYSTEKRCSSWRILDENIMKFPRKSHVRWT